MQLLISNGVAFEEHVQSLLCVVNVFVYNQVRFSAGKECG